MTEWEKLESKQIFDHPRITLTEDTVRLPDGQETKYLRIGGRHYSDFPTIIAINEVGKFLITEEHAYPINKKLHQFPEGIIDEGETVEEAASRELLEESGYQAATLEIIGTSLIGHRRSICRQYIIAATGIEKSTKSGGEAEEGDIGVHWYTESEIWQLIKVGTLIQKNALTAWAVYQAHKQVN